jgi:hypothetical protein
MMSVPAGNLITVVPRQPSIVAAARTSGMPSAPSYSLMSRRTSMLRLISTRRANPNSVRLRAIQKKEWRILM